MVPHTVMLLEPHGIEAETLRELGLGDGVGEALTAFARDEAEPHRGRSAAEDAVMHPSPRLPASVADSSPRTWARAAGSATSGASSSGCQARSHSTLMGGTA